MIIKSASKKMNTKNKTCKKFCKKVFLPEREKVDLEFSIEYNKKAKHKYQPIQVQRKTNKPFAKYLEKSFIEGCNDIYCQKSCKTTKNKWLKSFTKKRKEKLMKQGAISGCIDAIKEFPKYYKNI